MCRNIRPLFHFEPPVTDEEIRDASLQFVRKVSGFTKPLGGEPGARSMRRSAKSRRRCTDSSPHW